MPDRFLQRLKDAYAVRLLKEMIAIPSVVGQEGALAGYICDELQRLGLRCEMHVVEAGRPNVYASLEAAAPGPHLVFCGHTDTVPPAAGWSTDPFTPVEKDGRIYGLGACDMKAGLACMLNAVRAFAESGIEFKGKLSFAAVIDEEAFSAGARAMIGHPIVQADAVLLSEPYCGDASKPIPLGLTGKMLYDVRVSGKAAHGFCPEQGINAVEEAARLLTQLGRLEFKPHPRFGRGNTSTLKIEGGYSVYSVVVPAECRLEINRLLVPGETIAGAVEDMERLVRRLNLSARVEIQTKPPRYEACLLDPAAPILAIFDAVYQEVTGRAPVYGYERGITDANVFMGEAGIACIHLGPPRGGVHQKDEYMEREWIGPLSRMYALIAARFLEAAE
jgi:acetylornithine deacetylase/succinyl-diaminopimelate desuccinylase family protein